MSLSENTKTINRYSYDDYCYDSKNNQIIYYYGNEVYRISLTGYDGVIQCLSPKLGKIINVVSPNLVISYQEKSEQNYLYIHDLFNGNLVNTIELDGYLSAINGKKIIDIFSRQKALDSIDFDSCGIPEAKATVSYHNVFIYPCEWNVYYTVSTTKLVKEGSRPTTKDENTILCSFNSDMEIILKEGCGNFCIYGNAICYFNDYESYTTSKKYSGSGYTNGGTIYMDGDRIFLLKEGSLYTLSYNGYWDNRKEIHFDFSNFKMFGVIKDEDTNIIRTLDGTNLGIYNCIVSTEEPQLRTNEYFIFPGGRKLRCKNMEIIPTAFSEKFSFGIKITSKGVCICKLNNGVYTTYPIMEGLYDSSQYHDVILSEDGNYILYRQDDKTIVEDIKGRLSKSYENMSYVKHINGIRPLFSNPTSLQPRLINPITGQFIDSKKLTQYQFISPDGNLYADTCLNEYIEYYYKETNEIISHEKYDELLKIYSYPWKEDKESINWKKIAEKRKQLFLDNFEYLNNEYPKIFKDDKDGHSWNYMITQFSPCYFLSFLIGKRGIAIIRNISNDAEFTRIDLGSPLKFINYVAFSHDSEYVAIAGYRDSGGLFLVYDLKAKETIIHQNTNRAVWNVAFSATNALAAYTSSPNTFFAVSESDYEYEDFDNKLIQKRNFLTFSPNGEYFALSRQGYISKYDRDDNVREIWGHQPSSLVEIRKSTSCDVPLIQFSDLSDEGIADSFQRDSVASVSFSNDNTCVMMVGQDGVVIIRNLYYN